MKDTEAVAGDHNPPILPQGADTGGATAAAPAPQLADDTTPGISAPGGLIDEGIFDNPLAAPAPLVAAGAGLLTEAEIVHDWKMIPLKRILSPRRWCVNGLDNTPPRNPFVRQTSSRR